MRHLWAVAVVVAGCGAEVATVAGSAQAIQPLSFEEFKALTKQEPDTGIYLLNGDEIAESDEELAEAYQNHVEEEDAAAQGIAQTEQQLIVNQVRNRDDKWSATKARNLTYCINQKQFGSRYSQVVSVMATATGAWERVANVKFVHVQEEDSNCTVSNTAVVFDVQPTSGQDYLARAFFPSSSRKAREVIIDESSFGDTGDVTLTGVLRHELGHALGFRHEHTRPEAGKCYENSKWRALTRYDTKSVMHYPQCNGTNKGDLVLTALDAEGARALYP